MTVTVAILGAESTGKTSLAHEMLAQLRAHGTAAVCVAEYLRVWCENHQRTPLAHEQAPLAWQQAQHLAEAIQSHPADTIVLCDTTPLMTAVYSEMYFKDTALYAEALEIQRSFTLTLLTGLDIAWTADGIQRDSDAMRNAVDQRLRQVLAQHGLPYSMIYGHGQQRTANAMLALEYCLAPPQPASPHAWQFRCEKCSDAVCEHRMFRDLLANAD